MKAHQLEDALRALKLFGMLDTLGTRLAQATAGELGHVELLAVLCADETARREAAGLERRLRAARFESAAALEEFDFSFNPKVPAAQIRDLATLRFVEAGESVILHGPVGVGKTMVAQALGHAACRRGYTVAFTKTSRPGRPGRRTCRPQLARPAGPLGPARPVDPRRLRHEGLHDGPGRRPLRAGQRASGKPSIFTANRQASDWYSLFPNPVVAESILDRVVNAAHHVHMEGRSYRPNRRPGAAPKATRR